MYWMPDELLNNFWGKFVQIPDDVKTHNTKPSDNSDSAVNSTVKVYEVLMLKLWNKGYISHYSSEESDTVLIHFTRKTCNGMSILKIAEWYSTDKCQDWFY